MISFRSFAAHQARQLVSLSTRLLLWPYGSCGEFIDVAVEGCVVAAVFEEIVAVAHTVFVVYFAAVKLDGACICEEGALVLCEAAVLEADVAAAGVHFNQ